VPNTALDGPVRIFAGELLGIGTGVCVRRTVRVTLKGDGGHGDGRTFGKPLFEVVVFRLALGQVQPPAIIVDGNSDVICGGLNFGYFYDRSPIIAYDGEQAPTYTMGTFTSTTVPGCRVPHVWIDGRRSLYDAMGRITHCCASTPRRASPASSRRPRSAAFRSPFST
jgi:hypothetical protein